MGPTLASMPGPEPVAAWILAGTGVPARISIGALDCLAEAHLALARRHEPKYKTATRVLLGAAKVPSMPHEHDQAYGGQGGTLTIGGDAAPRPGRRRVSKALAACRPCTAFPRFI